MNNKIILNCFLLFALIVSLLFQLSSYQQQKALLRTVAEYQSQEQVRLRNAYSDGVLFGAAWALQNTDEQKPLLRFWESQAKEYARFGFTVENGKLKWPEEK